mmetsp:Transcript_141634/g.200570  ORF Transcript_141634/g.200570 Transcript_141634/m.200570 type:complete len:93 (+) Transcript_141634:94-372(+)
MQGDRELPPCEGTLAKVWERTSQTATPSEPRVLRLWRQNWQTSAETIIWWPFQREMRQSTKPSSLAVGVFRPDRGSDSRIAHFSHCVGRFSD